MDIDGTAGPDTLDGTEDSDVIRGLAGDDVLRGNGGDDQLLAGTGYDILLGGDGDDELFFAGDFTAADYADGGAGTDSLLFQGAYTVSQAFGAGQVYNIERIELLSGADTRFGDVAGNRYRYNLKTNDANLAAGQALTVDFSKLLSGENTTFDGSAESNGSFVVLGGAGDDTILGGARNDRLLAGTGFDILVGGSGNDELYFGADFTTADYVNGTSGNSDTLVLQGNYAATQIVGAGQMFNIDELELLSGGDARYGDTAGNLYTYNLRTSDANIAAGRSLTVDFSGLTAGEVAIFGARAETDGSLFIRGGFGADTFAGGAMNDTFTFGDGFWGSDDSVDGGEGSDTLNIQLAVGSNALTFAANQIFGIERLELRGASGGGQHGITLNDANVAAGQTMAVSYATFGGAASLFFDGSAETDGNLVVSGGVVDDVLIAGHGADRLVGAGGDDVLYFGASFGTGDQADGGAHTDTLCLQGNYLDPLMITPEMMTGISRIALLSGSNDTYGHASGAPLTYNIRLPEFESLYYTYIVLQPGSNGSWPEYITTRLELTVDFTDLGPEDSVIFGMRGEPSDSITFLGGMGNETIAGGGGDDVFEFGAEDWGKDDSIDGWTGLDTLSLAMGSGDATIAFAGNQLFNLETIKLTGASPAGTLTLRLHDANVISGSLHVDGRLVGEGYGMTLDGSAESESGLTIEGGSGNDVLIGGGAQDSLSGGAGNDWISGGMDRDGMTGGLGSDVFAYNSVEESTSAARDTIMDFTQGDLVDLRAIDADTGQAGDQAFTFIGATAFSGTAGELRAEEGLVFWSVESDTDGDGVADLEFHIKVVDSDPLTASDFVL